MLQPVDLVSYCVSNTALPPFEDSVIYRFNDFMVLTEVEDGQKSDD